MTHDEICHSLKERLGFSHYISRRLYIRVGMDVKGQWWKIKLDQVEFIDTGPLSAFNVGA